MGLRPFHLPLLIACFLLLCFTSSSSGGADPPVIELKLKAQQRHQLHREAGVLQMRRGAPFKIAIFADLHFGEAAWTDWGPLQDAKSIRVMSNILLEEMQLQINTQSFYMKHCRFCFHHILDTENPDFVVYLGDVITANNIPVANASLYWSQATSPTRDRGIPWASVFGNHDDMPFEWPMEWFSAPGIPQVHCPEPNSSCSGEEYCGFKGTQRVMLMKKEIEQNVLSYSKTGPKYLWPSISNYVLQLSSQGDPKSPVMFMYFLDSGGGSYPEVISEAQAKWFRQKSQEINPASKIPEVIFWHIPSKAYKKVAPWFGVRKPCVGSINKESVAAQEAEFGIMDMLTQRPSVKAIFVGHNHGLDWCCPYEGKVKVWMCYARHTGYGGYGNWDRGARLLEVTDNPFSLKSWIRMEDGEVHSEVVLSS